MSLHGFPADIWRVVSQFLNIQQLYVLARLNKFFALLARSAIKSQRKHRRHLDKISGFAKIAFSVSNQICCFAFLPSSGELMIGEVYNPKKLSQGTKISILSHAFTLIRTFQFNIHVLWDACEMSTTNSQDQRFVFTCFNGFVFIVSAAGEIIKQLNTSDVKIQQPSGVTADDCGNVYVVDSAKHCVQVSIHHKENSCYISSSLSRTHHVCRAASLTLRPDFSQWLGQYICSIVNIILNKIKNTD